MRTTLLVCFLAFLPLADSLQAADPFVGTWKLNVAKSKPIPAPPGMATKEETHFLRATSERYEITIKGTRDNGSTFSIRESFPQAGGPITYSEGGPPVGTSYAIKRINDSALDFTTTIEGTVVGTMHVTVSGKTLRLDGKGIDAQGKPFQALAVFDKQ